MKGADQNGQCYYVETAPNGKKLADSSLKQKSLVRTVNDKMYFDDPVFTFQDSMIYGCTVSMNYAELQDFCLNRGWNNLMIF